MALTNPTALATAVKASLDLCSVWVGETGTVYYPTAPGNASLPFAVIHPTGTSSSRIAAGSAGIPTGTVDIQFVFSAASKTTGQVEVFAESLQDQLVALQTGLFIRSAESSLASDPDDAASAAGRNTRSIIISLEFGLE